jgi:hypothetical protein
VLGDETFDGFAEVVPHVPSVGAVLGARSAVAGAVGEERRAVAADDLDTGVLAQPGGQRLGLAVGQQVDGLTGLAVEQNGAVPSALPRGELVHPQHPRHRPGWHRQRHHHAQHRHPADRDAQQHRQPDHGTSRQHDAQSANDPLQDGSSPTVTVGQPADLLREGHPRAPGVVTEQQPDRQLNQHRSHSDRRVRDPALVAAVRPGRQRPAPRTRANHRVLRACRDPQHATLHHHVFHQHRHQMREHQLQQVLTQPKDDAQDDGASPAHRITIHFTESVPEPSM